jgi:transcriptional regulator with XRE-family HTH domain
VTTGNVHYVNETALIVDEQGSRTPLGEFLTRLVKASDLGVAEIARRSHLSRSFLYLLMSDRQSPSVESLLSLLEVVGCDEVSSGGPDEPGDIALTWNDQRFWVRLPHGSRAAERSRSALRTLNTSPSAESYPASAPPEPPMPMSVPALAPLMYRAAEPAPAAFAAFEVVGGAASRVESTASDKSALLAELVSRASALDEEQLRLLIDNARLMGPR